MKSLNSEKSNKFWTEMGWVQVFFLECWFWIIEIGSGSAPADAVGIAEDGTFYFGSCNICVVF